jgi:hypothetical protein
MNTIIELHENQSAEAGRCGSCHFFDRRGNTTDWTGYCCVNLPPWAATKLLTPVEAGLSPERGLADNRSCDLYKPKHDEHGGWVEFRKIGAWKAGQRSSVR